MVPPLRKWIRRLKNSIASRVINKPSSVPQKWRQSFIWITSCLAILSDTPGRLSGPPQTLPYSVLLHVGFIKLTSHLATGELLPRLSILTTTASCPQAKPCGGFRFYDTFLKVTLTGRYPALLLYGARTFLKPRNGLAIVFHTRRHIGIIPQ